MKVLVEVKNSVEDGDILVYDEKENIYKPISMQTFCHDLYEKNEATNERIDDLRSSLKASLAEVYELINKLSTALMNKEGTE